MDFSGLTIPKFEKPSTQGSMWLSAVKRVSFKGATIHPDTLNLFLD